RGSASRDRLAVRRHARADRQLRQDRGGLPAGIHLPARARRSRAAQGAHHAKSRRLVPRLVRETLVSLRDLLLAWGPFIAIGIALLVAAYVLLDPTPPHRVVLATGPENSAYDEFGKRYAEELKRSHIQVELRHTAGSRENLVLLRDGKEHVDLAFVQGGASETIRTDAETPEPVVSLGSLFYEPVWIFYRAERFAKFDSLTA